MLKKSVLDIRWANHCLFFLLIESIIMEGPYGRSICSIFPLYMESNALEKSTKKSVAFLLWIFFSTMSSSSSTNCLRLMSCWSLIISLVGLSIISRGFLRNFLKCSFYFRSLSSWLAAFSFALEVLFLPHTSFSVCHINCDSLQNFCHLDHILQATIDPIKVNSFIIKKTRSRWYSAETMADADHTDDLVLLANIPTQAKSLLLSLEQAVRGIDLYVNTDKTSFVLNKIEPLPL